MPSNTGLDAQIGYVAESTYGTGVVVTRFIPLVSETMQKEIEAVESEGILAGRQVLTSQQWAQGNASCSGDVQHELFDQSMGLLLRAAFGTVNTVTAGGTGVHTFFPANPSVSLTMQIGHPQSVSGSVTPFTYTGTKIQSWEIGASAGEILTWGMSVIAQEETLGTALATASYATNIRPWVFKSATVTVDGTTVPVMEYKIQGENNLTDDRRFLGSTVISEPLRQELAAYTGEMSVEWGNPSSLAGTQLYQRFQQGAESTLVATMASGTLRGTISANVRFDGSSPQIGGRGLVEHSIPFKAVASGSLDSHAITVVITNNDTAA